MVQKKSDRQGIFEELLPTTILGSDLEDNYYNTHWIEKFTL